MSAVSPEKGQNLTVAYTPCPNDTFMFHSIASGKRRLVANSLVTRLFDIETLNEQAMCGIHDITKLSFPAFLKVRETYKMLRVGAVLGFGCGPIVVAPGRFSRSDVPNSRVAIPGDLTTAAMLFKLWAPDGFETLAVPYNEIAQTVLSGKCDCGVMIHEGRFTFKDIGLELVADLGEWWETKYEGLPVPLGCIAARRNLGDELIGEFEECLLGSIHDAGENPPGLQEYMKKHAQELDDGVLEKHTTAFVNEFTRRLDDRCEQALSLFTELAASSGEVA